MKQLLFTLIGSLLIGLIQAQPEISIVASDLRSPVGIERDINGALWIAEAGTGQEDGAVSVIWPDGTVERVIDSLPSFFDAAIGEILGPSRAQPIDDRYLGVFSGEAPSPVASSILIYAFSEIVPGGQSLRLWDAVHVIGVADFVFGKGLPESNPYTMVDDGCNMYIVDAAANAIVRRDGLTGVLEFFTEFPDFPNPLPFGPPSIQAVPTRLLHHPDGGFLVSQLTGFPFVEGAANIYHVDEQGAIAVLHDNLTLVTDMAFSPDGDGLYVLEFARFNLDSVPPFYFNSAQIVHLHEDQSRDTLLAGFGPSPGLTLDAEGNCYVTHLFFGLVLKIENKTSGIASSSDNGNKDGLVAFPNPVSDLLYLDFQLPVQKNARIVITDLMGRVVFTDDLGVLPAGMQHVKIDSRQWPGRSLDVSEYLVRLEVGEQVYHRIVITKN